MVKLILVGTLRNNDVNGTTDNITLNHTADDELRCNAKQLT